MSHPPLPNVRGSVSHLYVANGMHTVIGPLAKGSHGRPPKLGMPLIRWAPSTKPLMTCATVVVRLLSNVLIDVNAVILGKLSVRGKLQRQLKSL